MTPSEQYYQCPKCGRPCPCCKSPELDAHNGSVGYIPLTKGKFAIVDAENLDWLSKWKWYSSTTYYAIRAITLENGNRRFIKMHREILGLQFGNELVGDHINGNRLDNRKVNLRAVAKKHNSWNKRLQPNESGRLRGVVAQPPNRFRAQIIVDGKVINLGSRKTSTAAHELYKEASRKYLGKYSPYS